MTIDDFVKSLSADQNAALIAFRDQINAGRDKAHQDLVDAKANELAGLVAAGKSVASELAALKTFASSLLDQARKIDHPDVQAIVAEADKPENQRKKEALQAQISELTKQAEAIV